MVVVGILVDKLDPKGSKLSLTEVWCVAEMQKRPRIRGSRGPAARKKAP